MATVTATSSTRTYHGNATITFTSDDLNGLSVTIDTERLHMRSVEDTTKDPLKIRIKDIWVKRWHENDPYSGFAVFKNYTDEFLGYVVLDHGEEAGEATLDSLFLRSALTDEYEREALTAVAQEYGPAIVREGYLLNGKRLEKIIATAHATNILSELQLCSKASDRTQCCIL